MKIIVTGTRGFPNVQGGVEAHCEHLYPCLVRIVRGQSPESGDSPHRLRGGCDVTVMTRASYVDPALKEYRGVKLVPVNNPRKKSLEAIVHTFKAVFKAKHLGCDIVHIHAVGPALLE